MSHTEAELRVPSPNEGFDPDEPKAGAIGILAGVLIAVLLVLLFLTQAYFQHATDQQVYEKVLVPVGDDITALHAKETSQLHSYGYVDRTKGVVRIPIERAMELMEKEYAAGGKVYYSTKPTEVKTPEPAAPAPGTPAAPGTPPPATPGKTNVPSPAH